MGILPMRRTSDPFTAPVGRASALRPSNKRIDLRRQLPNVVRAPATNVKNRQPSAIQTIVQEGISLYPIGPVMGGIVQLNRQDRFHREIRT
jgi:hypothetical protein